MNNSIIKSILMKALVLAKKDEQVSRDTSLTKDIGKILIRHFKSREFREEVKGIVSGRATGSSPASPSNMTTQTDVKSEDHFAMKVWQGPDMSKKATNKPTSEKQEKGAADNLAADDANGALDDININELAEMNAQKLLDNLGTIAAIKKVAKDLGMLIDQSLEPMKFIGLFQEELIILSMEGQEEDPQSERGDLQPESPLPKADQSQTIPPTAEDNTFVVPGTGDPVGV